MTRIVFSELLGGRVFEVDDLEPATLGQIGAGFVATPSGPSTDPSGRVLVAETGSHGIALAEPGGAWQRFGVEGDGVGEFSRPSATAFLGAELVILDAGNCRVVSIADVGGAGWVSFGHQGRPTAADPAERAFADPRGLAVDTAGRVWVADPGANRVTRVDAIDGSGWVEIALPAAPRPALPYGLAAFGDGVAVLDVGNRRVVVFDGAGAATSVDLAGDPWVAPVFVAGTGDILVVADVAANALRLLQPGGKEAAFEVTATLRGSPPDVVQPLFDSLGGVCA